MNNQRFGGSRRSEVKKPRRLSGNLIAWVSVALIGFFVFINWHDLTEFFRGSVPISGFPVRIPGNAHQFTKNTILPFDTGFILLTDTHIYVYNGDGSLRFSERHNYSEPLIEVAKSRFIVYDLNGEEHAIFGKKGLIRKTSTEQRILYGTIGNSESYAVVYRSPTYASVLQVYNKDGGQRYLKRLSDRNVMQTKFTQDDKEIITSMLSFDGGVIIAAIEKFNLSSDDETGVWRTQLPAGSVPIALHTGKENVFVLCDNRIYALDIESGKMLGKYDYGGLLIDFDFTDAAALLLVDGYITEMAGSVNLILLSDTAEPIEVAGVSKDSVQVRFRKNQEDISLLEEVYISRYNSQLEQVETFPLAEDYAKFAHVNDEILLLGFGSVDKLFCQDDIQTEIAFETQEEPS